MLNSISNSNSNQKNKLNIEKFDKSNKIKVYFIESNDENAKIEKKIEKKMMTSTIIIFRKILFITSCFRLTIRMKTIILFILSRQKLFSILKYFIVNMKKSFRLITSFINILKTNMLIRTSHTILLI